MEGSEREQLERHVDVCPKCRLVLSEGARSYGERRPSPFCGPICVFEQGDLVGTRYSIVRFLGRGGMGEVYEAEDLLLGEHVALKTLAAWAGLGEAPIARMKNEVQTARRVTHPNVCRIFDLGVHQSDGDSAFGMPPTVFFTMELIHGETLARRVRRGGPVPLEEAMGLARQMAEALDAAHRAGVVHRDFKSDNVMLTRGDGEHVRAVVTDFGLAKPVTLSAEGSSGSTTAQMAGTVAYMAPEQVLGEPATTASDIDALGVVLYEMVTGHMPFEGRNVLATAAKRLHAPPRPPSAFRPGLPAAWDSAILRCLHQTPGERFRTARELVSRLEQAGGVTVGDPRRTASERLRRRRAIWLASAFLALAGGTPAAIRMSGRWHWLRPDGHREAGSKPEQASGEVRDRRVGSEGAPPVTAPDAVRLGGTKIGSGTEMSEGKAAAKKKQHRKTARERGRHDSDSVQPRGIPERRHDETDDDGIIDPFARS